MHKEISNYLTKNNYPFHMPGHKGNTDFFPKSPFSFDLTEIRGMDIISEPTGIIKHFQEKIANFFCAKESFFLTGGASAGVIASVCAVSNKKIFAARNAHVSFYNALVFSGAKAEYFLPEITQNGLSGGISLENFNNLPNGAVVFLVSPTYEGFVSDISEIAKKIHARDGILIVDEAHGTHFPFHKKFPKSALKSGADIVINSLHKTLPAVSGCALLHVNSTRVDLRRLKYFINAIQTTSPSYMLMASCDFMLEKLWNEPVLFEEYVLQLEKFRKNFINEKIKLIGREIVGTNAIFDIDEGKLLFSTKQKAAKISEILADEYKIQLEMEKGKHLLAMTSVADKKDGFERLQFALKKIKLNFIEENPVCYNINIPQTVLSPREAIFSETEIIPTVESIGRISAELIADYPPGIAIIAPGEIICEKINKSHISVVKTKYRQI